MADRHMNSAGGRGRVGGRNAGGPKTTRNGLFLLIGPLLALALGAFLLAVWVANQSALAKYRQGDMVSAAESFRTQATLTRAFPEPWKALFNQGTAHLVGAQYDTAAEVLTSALEKVPAGDMTVVCMVRINLALAHEGLGDSATDSSSAQESYRTAMDVIGPCTSDGASAAGQSTRPTGDSESDLSEQRLWDKSQPAEGEGEDEEQPAPDSARSEDLLNQLNDRNQVPVPALPGTGSGAGRNW